jgi:outer membrane protein OmpA-like peptidoglycan-associated protein
MSESFLSFASTTGFRRRLLARNLSPYNVPGVYSPQVSQIDYETNLSESSVIDSPGEQITNGQYSNGLYPLNEYGPDGGYNLSINFNGPPQPRNSNKGEYDPTDTELDILNEAFIDTAYLVNSYGPVGGFTNMVTITDDLQVTRFSANSTRKPYWDPPSFVSSIYSPYTILTETNPTGDEGPLSNDSYLAKLGAESLRFALQSRVAAGLTKKTVGSVNLDSFKDPFQASLMVSGQEPLIYRDYRITIPEGPVSRAFDLVSNLSGTYWPSSPIPGDYFDENTKGGQQSSQTSKALTRVNDLTGGLLGPILNIRRNPSEIFLANTGNGQKSVLFKNLNFNRFQPDYNKNYGGLLGVAQSALSLLGIRTGANFGGQKAGYYVGSKTSEPSTITSPPNQIPVDEFGKQIATPVYGPSELGKLYENNVEKVEFTFRQKQDGISGGFVWSSKKTKDAQGFTVKPPSDDGGSGISTVTKKNTSTPLINNFTNSNDVELKPGSILYETQRLVESADASGGNRLKHVGNAINQVSKVFNDGYKTITKGSQVIRYKDNTTGEEAGTEYCRLFTKDTPYYSYSDLQKSAGITKEGRRFSYSVIDNTYNLNIVPLRGDNSTNIVKGPKGNLQVKKYMFSLENLAWRTSSRPGYTVDELPACEQGPSGGRIMWFPPYDLTFNDSSSAQWNETQFLGRPEPVFTYKHTTRKGSISWKIIVDSPSVLNVITDKILKNQTNEKVDSILSSFFAGCTKYDIYELAKKYNTFTTSELLDIQAAISRQQLTADEIEELLNRIPKKSDTSGTNVQKDQDTKDFESKFVDYGFYFDYNVGDGDYESLYNTYVSNKDLIQTNSDTIDFKDAQQKNVTDFFTNVIENNYKFLTEGEESFIKKAEKILTNNNRIDIELEGTSSNEGGDVYNQGLSKQRSDSVVDFILSKLEKFKENIKITSKSLGEKSDSTPKSSTNGPGGKITCSEPIEGVTGTLTNEESKYAVNSIACRRVIFKKVSVTPIPEKKEEEQKEVTINDSGGINNVNPYIPKTNVQITEDVRQGIGKKILRKLLSECDYFDVLKNETPMAYNSIREKIKYFNPAFHSMTPEGLNARLTFLNQCVRPGDTIPVIGPDGKPKSNDALNTSFGSPPVLILRIGDFYHTKIIPRDLQINYDPYILDFNPEGIGLQPMIAKVTLSFDFIGGHGIARPVEQLQNALSFNYYANTEVYDERAAPTEDTSALDKEIFDTIMSKVTNEKPQTKPENRGGKTIGDIATTVPVQGGETGIITYQKIMDSALSSSKEYFTNVMNFTETIFKQNNYGVLQLLTQERGFVSGNFEIGSPTEGVIPSPTEVKIYGKPTNFEQKVDNLFKKSLEDVDNKTNYIVKYISETNIFKESDIDRLKINLKQYIQQIQTNFSVSISKNIQDFTISQQDMVQNFRKINCLNNRTDGKILENGTPFVYTIKGTDEVTNTSFANTFNELYVDYENLSIQYQKYNDFIEGQSLLLSSYPTEEESAGDFVVLDVKAFENIQDKRLFMIMSQIFIDNNKLTSFKEFLLSQGLKEVKKFEKKLNKACENFKNIVEDELEAESDFLKKIKENKQFIDFQKVDVYPKGKVRKLEYTTVNTTEDQKNLIKDVWSNQNANSDTEVWEGKLIFK